MIRIAILTAFLSCSAWATDCQRYLQGELAEHSVQFGQQLRTSAKISEGLRRAMDVAYRQSPHQETRERLVAARAMAQANLDHYRVSLNKMRELFNLLKERSMVFEEEADGRLAKVDSLLQDFVPRIEDYVIRRRNFFMNDRSDTSTKMVGKIEDMEERFKILSEQEMRLPTLFRRLQESPNLLNSGEVQQALRELVFRGLEGTIRHVIENSLELGMYDGGRLTSLAGFLRVTLPGTYGAPLASYDRENSTDVKVKLPIPLLAVMMTEILRNAGDAYDSRHPGEMDWDKKTGMLRIRVDGNGDALIEVEDWGYPARLAPAAGIGNTTHGSTGIGRFRTQILANYLGYDVTYAAKPDDSGSIVTVRIPARHLAE